MSSTHTPNPAPLSPEEIGHIADIIASQFPLCADQLREHARAMRNVSDARVDWSSGCPCTCAACNRLNGALVGR